MQKEKLQIVSIFRFGHKKRGLFQCPLMGGVIELVQAYCTGGTRSGEWLDLAADSLGVLIGQPIGMLLVACHARWRKGRAED